MPNPLPTNQILPVEVFYPVCLRQLLMVNKVLFGDLVLWQYYET